LATDLGDLAVSLVPGHRLPLTRFEYGEFCADEIEYSRDELEKMEADGLCAGVQWVPRSE